MESVDADETPTPSGRGSRGRAALRGCLGVLLAGVVVVLAAVAWWFYRAEAAAQEALRLQEEAAAQVFDAAQAKLEEAEASSYDIDQTIRVIHSIDVALQEHEDFEGYLRTMARQDYRDVAPEVLASRRELLEVLQPLYAKQVELEDQQAMWEMTSELLLATLSVVSVSGDMDLVAPSGSFGVDREQAQVLWEDLKQRRADRQKLQRDLAELDEQLVDALVDYAGVYYRYVEEWDALSLLRDRAYLAAHNGDWSAAASAARLAVEQAPKEREAHLLLAMALIEGGKLEQEAEVRALLEETMQQHPDQSAPALLLLGVLEAKLGRGEEARLAFQQAAAYYPKQSDALLDMLDPYQMRSFLSESREGSFIIEQYTATMLGAGYFSPDLQLARQLFQSGDFAGGRAKVLDHFARRRNQKQWDFILDDITFCQELLGPDFWRIFPEDTYLDLEASQAMMGSSLHLAVNNRSPRTLRNATLVMVLHLTDMVPGMYEALPALETVPAVVAHETTSFGSLPVEVPYSGTVKTVDDIVELRAILVTNDAVVWVDTDAYKVEKATRTAAPEPAPTQGLRPIAQRHPEFLETREAIVARLSQAIDLQIEQKYGSDNVLIELPRELSILRPMFRLRIGDEVFAADDNLIEGDRIRLRFAGVQNFDGVESPDDLQLVVGSPFGDLVLTWTASGQLTWDYAGVDVGPSMVP